MNAYHWVLLVACASSAFTAGTILVRDSRSSANRLAALLSLSACYWAACEIAWNTASDPARALLLMKLSAPGWMFVGPISAHVVLAAGGAIDRVGRRALHAAYAGAAVMLGVEWTTPWLHPAAVQTSWGFAGVVGPAFLPLYGGTLATVGFGLYRGIRHFLRTASPGERRQGRWLLLGFGLPVAVGAVTDGLLPFLGHQPPRLGTLCLACLSGVIAWSIHRYGYSVLAPGQFAPEILEVLSEGVLVVRPNGEIRIANRAAGALVGDAARALVGRPLDRILPEAPALAEPRNDLVETTLLARGGERIPVSLTASQLRDRRGNPIASVLVVRDLREMIDLRSRLVISGRLAAVGELAAGIAHEINNPISYVRSNLRLLGQHWLALGAELEKSGSQSDLGAVLLEGESLLDESLEGVDRVATIVRDVRGISNVGGIRRDPVDLGQALDRVLRIVRHRVEAPLETAIGDLPMIEGSSLELEQVFLNLVLNADHAMKGRPGGIRISAGQENDRVVVAVADTGAGIPPERLEKIFDPFFTTKEPGEGTGLGLAISYQIVRKHGGAISVTSTPGAGTTFRVSLPPAPDA